MSEYDQYIIIVGASDLVMPAYQIAREKLALGIISLDQNIKAPGMQYADVSLQISTKDINGAIEAAKEIAGRYPVKGVFTCGADVELTVASIAQALKLPGVDVEVAKRCNDKLLMHRFLDSKGFTAKPKYELVVSRQNALEKAAKLGYPIFVKPIDNCGSRGVQRVDDAQELEAAYELAAHFNMNYSTQVLLEKCLEGSKHTVEMIADKGERHLISIVDTHYISKKWPCETGLNTTRLSIDMQQEVYQFASDLADIMGITSHAHKVDINVSAEGKIDLIELAARLSGGFHCQYASPLAYGTEEIQAAMELAIGHELDVDKVRHKYEKAAAVEAVFPEPGVVKAIRGISECRNARGVSQVFLYVSEGDKVGPYLNSTDRPAFVIAEGDDPNDAVTNAKNAVTKLHIMTE